MAITHIHSAYIPVKDLDAALDFYINKVGWEKRVDAQVDENFRFLTIAPKGALTEIGLMQSDGTSKNEYPIALSVNDIQATYDELTAKGVEFTRPISVESWGDKGAEFVDPDGNTFYLNERG